MGLSEGTPEGMLRLRKEGEADRFCFPCHGDGWQALGWTVVAGLDTASPASPGGAVLLPQAVTAEPAASASLDYSAMTKAQIIAAVEEHHGVLLDGSLTKAQLVAEAEALAAGGAAQAPEAEAVVITETEACTVAVLDGAAAASAAELPVEGLEPAAEEAGAEEPLELPTDLLV